MLRVLISGSLGIFSAVISVKDFHVDPQPAAQKMNAPLDKLMEKLNASDYEQKCESDY